MLPVELMSAYWGMVQRNSQTCSPEIHNQADKEAFFLSYQDIFQVRVADTHAWVCNLLCAKCYRNSLQTRTLQLLKIINPCHTGKYLSIKMSSNTYRFCMWIINIINKFPKPNKRRKKRVGCSLNMKL